MSRLIWSKYFYLISANCGRFFACGASANKKIATFVCSFFIGACACAACVGAVRNRIMFNLTQR